MGPGGLVIMRSPRRIHSIISGREVVPHKSRQRAGSALEMISPSNLSSLLPRMAKRVLGNRLASRETSSENLSTGQRLLSQRAPGWRVIQRLPPMGHFDLMAAAICGCAGSHWKFSWTGTPSGGSTDKYQSTAWVWKVLRGTATS